MVWIFANSVTLSWYLFGGPGSTAFLPSTLLRTDDNVHVSENHTRFWNVSVLSLLVPGASVLPGRRTRMCKPWVCVPWALVWRGRRLRGQFWRVGLWWAACVRHRPHTLTPFSHLSLINPKWLRRVYEPISPVLFNYDKSWQQWFIYVVSDSQNISP